MTIKEIATALLERRSRMTHVVLPGDIVGQLGPEGVQQALQRTWLEADYDSGALKVTNNLGLIAEMERIAEIVEGTCPKCNDTTCRCEPPVRDESAHRFAVDHSNRGARLLELVAPGSGQPDKATTAPSVKPNVDANRSEDHMVGEDVVIASEGKTFPAKIKSKNNDGTFALSFGPNRPPGERNYRKEEIQKVEPGDTQLVR